MNFIPTIIVFFRFYPYMGEALISKTLAPLRELGSGYARAGRRVENDSYMAKSTL